MSEAILLLLPGAMYLWVLFLGQSPLQEVVREKETHVLSRLLSPSELVAVTRSHWGIENQLHWVLDVVFDEDRARNRKDNGPANLALLRKLALNMLRSHPDNASIRRKVKKAGWDDAFLISMLTQMR